MKKFLLKLKIYLHKFIFGYEHDWTNDFYLIFYDKNVINVYCVNF